MATWASNGSQADVAAKITSAADGDTITLPAGTFDWASGVTVTGKGLIFTGAGTPNNSAATVGPSASATQTVLRLGTGAVGFTFYPTYGNALSRVSCMQVQPSGSSARLCNIKGTGTASGHPNIRLDNLTLPSSWGGVSRAAYGLCAITNVFGVLDHNAITGPGTSPGPYLQFVEYSHSSYLGQGVSGDYAWTQPEDYGTEKFLFIENNRFTTAGSTESEATADGYYDEGGGRAVVRYNTFDAVDTVNFTAGFGHGTESRGRARSGRCFEYYGNTINPASSTNVLEVMGTRGGTGLVWGNTVAIPGGSSVLTFCGLTSYRCGSRQGNPQWGVCDGSSGYDTNDGTTYWSGTVGSYNAGTRTITVSGGSPGWTSNQWCPNGAPYSVHDVTQNNGGEIIANGANTLQLITPGPGFWEPSTGDAIQILRATVCLDQAGGRGAGRSYSGDPASPELAANQAAVPLYVWLTTFTGGTPSTHVSSYTRRVIRNRDFYHENVNQAAQTSASTPFDGSTTIGVGHGTLANRPSSGLTAGVAYWATDTQTLYVVTGVPPETPTWTPYYTPYTYPHPLTGGILPPTGTITLTVR